MARSHYNGTAVIPFPRRQLKAEFQSIVCNLKKSSAAQSSDLKVVFKKL